jgi:hypothetical protein
MPWVGDSLPAQHTIPHSKHQSAQFLTSQACSSCILFLFVNTTCDRCVGIVYRENGIVNRKVHGSRVHGRTNTESEQYYFYITAAELPMRVRIRTDATQNYNEYFPVVL